MRKFSEMEFYSLADAKKKFSTVVNDCKEKEIIVTKNGKPVSVMMDYERYMKLMDFLSKVKDLYLMELSDDKDISLIKNLNLDYFIDENNQEV
ncbi:MAG TPA: type II toxin-antitoxin system Phd/YefM family antitoxin [Thermotogota bacterium]|nr:type II toxin-antitoxin system Phd/YefM family antitoxin [Thermotogota bacterium]